MDTIQRTACVGRRIRSMFNVPAPTPQLCPKRIAPKASLVMNLCNHVGISTATNLIVICAFVTPALAQDAPQRPTPEQIAEYRELTRPGPEHDLMAKFAGSWNVTVTGAGRSAPSKGGGTSYMTLERRFLWIGYGARGRSGNFRGSFTLGFDRRNERFDLIAMDTDGTYFITSHGTQDPETGRIKLYGKDDDPYMKSLGFEKEFAHVIDFRDEDHFTSEVLYIDTRTPERKEMKGMELTFERKVPPPEKETQAPEE